MTRTYALTESEAKALLSPYAQFFYNAILDGFEDFMQIQKSGRPIVKPSAKATAVWDYVTQRLQKLAVDNRNKVRLINRRGMVIVVLEDKIAVRIKKYSASFRPANILTQQVKDFRNHKFSLTEKQTLYPVDIAYRVNPLFTEIADVHYVSPDGLTQNLWKMEIVAADAGRVRPLLISQEVADDSVPVVRLKTDTDQNAKTGTES